MSTLETRIPPPLVMLASGILMWVLHHWLPVLIWITPPWTYFGIVLAITGLMMDIVAIRHFRQARTTVNPLQPDQASALVTGGIFRFSRNPMYVGFLFQICGWACWLGSLSPWLIIPLFVIFISRFQIAPEERVLREKFAKQYIDYAKSVPRWIAFPIKSG